MSGFYGQDWLRSQQLAADARKPRKIVNKKDEAIIQSKINALTEQRSMIYADDTLTDEQVREQGVTIGDEIHRLIDSMYETREQIQQRIRK